MNNSSEVGLSLSTIGMLIVAARRSIRQLIAAKVVPMDITPHHYWMLMILLKGAPMSLGELARAMWMDNPTVSRMVQQMGLRGYLTVGPDPTHGRRIRIRLTPDGLTLCEKLTAIGEDYQVKAQKDMTPEEIAMMRELLCKYMRNLDVMVANELPGMPIRPHHHHPVEEDHPKASGI
jgi:DNA-binding MarR family transcriptional regulator